MTCYADGAFTAITQIVENIPIARETMRLRVCVPQMANKVVPGQFFMVRNPSGNDPLIGRAFALYEAAQDAAGWIDLVYLVKGKLTTSLCKLSAGDEVALWGPLGNGFACLPTEHLIMVAGGIGQTPFLSLAKEALGKQAFGASAARQTGYATRVSLCYGARNVNYLAGLPQFQAVGVDVQVATEDGSAGRQGLVTELLASLLQAEIAHTRVVCCGPEPMMEAASKIAEAHQVECHVSLETPMACGIGICFSCVAKVGSASDWDYKRTCLEGPIFDSREIVWQ